MRLLVFLARHPTVRRFGLNVIVYGTVLLVELALILVLMGLGGGGLGMSLGLGLVTGVALLSIPGMLLSSALLVRPPARRRPALSVHCPQALSQPRGWPLPQSRL
jgi:hypothetical protein